MTHYSIAWKNASMRASIMKNITIGADHYIDLIT